MSIKFNNLQDHLLIAMPVLKDINFSRSVVYICAHSDDGAMGIMINQPLLDIDLGEVMKQMDIELGKKEIAHLPVLLGGPVQPERGFILHNKKQLWESSLVTSDELAVTSSQDILQALAEGKGPHEFLIMLGYAGWGSGELEKEILANDWLVAPANHEILFDTPFEKRWEKAAESIGVDIHNLSSDVGHA